MTNASQELTVSDIVRTVRRQYKVVIGIPLVVTLAAVVFALASKNTYRAEGVLEIGRVKEYPLEAPPTVVDRIGTEAFLAEVGGKLGMKDVPPRLKGMVEVEPVYADPKDRSLTRGVKVAVQSDNPEKSARFAKGIMEAVVAEHGKIYDEAYGICDQHLAELEDAIALIRAQIERGHDDLDRMMKSGAFTQVEIAYLAAYVEEKESYIIHLEEKAQGAQEHLDMEIYTHPTRITVEPIVPMQPSGPNRRLIVLVAFGVSLVMGIVVAFFFDRLSGEESEARIPVEDEKKKRPPALEPEPTPEPTLPTRPPEPTGGEPPRVEPPEVNRLPDQRDLTPFHYRHLVRSQAWIVVVTLVVGLVLGLIYGLAKPREYKTDFVMSTGIVGDHWLHSPMVMEEQCMSHWFLSKLSARLNNKYDVFDLQDMIEAELVMTPTKGLTRELKITVKAETPDDCFALANNLARLLEEADSEVYEQTLKMYEGYLADLEKVLDRLTAAPGGLEAAALAPGLAVFPPDEETEYSGGAQVYSLFSRSIPYEDNPYALSGLALFQQVYVDTYIKTRSPIFSQPTTVIVPPQKPTKPEGPGPISIVVIVLFISLVLGVTLAAVNYRLRQARSGT